MELGESRTTNMLLRFLDQSIKNELELFVQDTRTKKFIEIKTMEDLNVLFSNNISLFLNNLTEEELMNIRSYTGYNFRNINAILRNNWTYEENGSLTEDNKKSFLELSNNISNSIQKFPPASFPFITFRGTNLSSFQEYGVHSIKDLESLKGKYMYEQGFTSTSIIEDTCYFNKTLETGNNYNIKIKYLITPEYDEGALLISNETSYSINQNEYILNKNCLSRVIDVVIDEVLEQAILTVVVIPRKKYDFTKENEVKSK